jgi:hypothetical protein
MQNRQDAIAPRVCAGQFNSLIVRLLLKWDADKRGGKIVCLHHTISIAKNKTAR